MRGVRVLVCVSVCDGSSQSARSGVAAGETHNSLANSVCSLVIVWRCLLICWLLLLLWGRVRWLLLLLWYWFYWVRTNVWFFVCSQLVQLRKILLRCIEGGQVGGMRADKLAAGHLHNLLASHHRQLHLLSSFLLLFLNWWQGWRHVVLLHVWVERLSLPA